MLQEKALAILKSGRNVFLTGSAGSGKTFLLNQYITYLRTHHIPVAITASTGIAATLMNGMTVHAWSGIGISDHLSFAQLQSIKGRDKRQRKIIKAKVLIIDEISMLHKNQFELVNRVLKFVKEIDLPFGGMQIIVSGDFFQLPPISKDETQTSRDKFAFMSEAWQEAKFAVCYLSEQHRQGKDALTTVLNDIRGRKVSDDTVEILQNANFYPDDTPIKLFTHNFDVDGLNQHQLQQLEYKSVAFEAQTTGSGYALENLIKSVLAPQKLELKVSAQVMFLRNNYDKNYMNGTLGEVVGFEDDQGWPIVKLRNGKEVVAEAETWASEDEFGGVRASFTQVPLRLAWAITVHKSQGMTLEMAEVDLSRTFERGQGYVALSRLRNIDGLFLRGLNQIALEVDDLAFKADKRFKELSDLYDTNTQLVTLEKDFKLFILKMGGVVNIKPNALQIDSSKTNKSTTIDLTANLLKEQKSLEEIAELRSITINTLLSHVEKIALTYTDIDLSYLKPSDTCVIQVAKAVKHLTERNNTEDFIDGKVRLKALHEHLEGAIDYGLIRLALLFIA